jgi:rubrerythrin
MAIRINAGARGLLEQLIVLDYDAIASYQAALDRLHDQTYRSQLESFMHDHERHVDELEPFIRQLGGKPPTRPPGEASSGKLQLADLDGDNAILRTMLSYEGDTNSAYEQALAQAPEGTREALADAREDERRHWEWLASALAGKPVAQPR